MRQEIPPGFVIPEETLRKWDIKTLVENSPTLNEADEANLINTNSLNNFVGTLREDGGPERTADPDRHSLQVCGTGIPQSEFDFRGGKNGALRRQTSFIQVAVRVFQGVPDLARPPDTCSEAATD